MQKANPNRIHEINLQEQAAISAGASVGAIITGAGAGVLIKASAVTGAFALGLTSVGALTIAAVPGVILGIVIHDTIQHYSTRVAESTAKAPSIDEQLKQQQKTPLNTARKATHEAQASSATNLNQQRDLLHTLNHTHTKAAQAVNAAATAAQKVEKIIPPLQTAASNTTATLNNITQQLKDAAMEIAALKKTIALLTPRLSEKEQALSTSVSLISKTQRNLDANVTLANTQLAKLPSQLHYIDEMMGVRAKLNVKDEELAALKTTISTLRAKNSEQLTRIQQLTSELNDVVSKKNELAYSLNRLSNSLANRATPLPNAQTDFSRQFHHR